MKMFCLFVVCVTLGAAGCAWVRPPEPTGYPHASDYHKGSPQMESAVSGLPTETVSADRNRSLNRFREDFGGRR